MIFENRTYAGVLLGAELLKKKYPKPHVFALPRGGVPVAYEVARELDAPLDIIVVRKLGTPFDPELGFGAIAPGGIELLDHNIIKRYQLHIDAIETVRKAEKAELERRSRLYHGWNPGDLSGQSAIVVDDGLATGISMTAAITYLRKFHPAKLIVAVPVAPDSIESQFIGVVDELVCLYFDEDFISVGDYYNHFPQLSDEDVTTILGQN